MGRARKSAAEKEAQAAVKVRKEQSQTIKTLADHALEQLNRKLAQKPLLVQHFKSLMVMGAFDAVDRQQPEEAIEEPMPGIANKFYLFFMGEV